MKAVRLIVLGLAGAALSLVGASLEEGFANPPAENRPVVWWWFNANAPESAITRDLEALKRVGIAGFHVYGGSPTVRNWVPRVKWALHEAARLGLDGWVCVGAAGCGHRETPLQFAPKDLVWTFAETEGGGPIALTLPKKGVKETPQAPDGSPAGFRDVATLAVPVGGKATPAPGDVRDVSRGLDAATGAFTWPDAPKGRWRIIRFGFVPKVFGWHGCYIDHLSRAALDNHWARVMTPLLNALAPDERSALRGVLCDSWEAGTTSWTETFPAEFRARRGYDVLPWLVTRTGLTLGDRDATRRFARDFDLTIGDLIADNHYAYKSELAHRFGLETIAEACGPHQRHGDVRAAQGRCDVAMGEFWMPSNHRPALPQRFMLRDAATAAHVYGLGQVLAESFTTIGTYWTEYPATLKPCADRAFCDGLTRVCYHGMKLSPSLTDRPGAVRDVGTHYNPQITWFEQSRAFNLYLARCSWMLSRGRFAADCLIYAGDAKALFAGMKDPADGLGEGYDYDYCPTELLLKARVADGAIVLPSGMSYRALVLSDRNPKTCANLRPGKAVKIVDFPRVPCAVPPEAEAKLREIAAAGGVVLRTRSERAAWLAHGALAPDVIVSAADVDWIHRQAPATGIYFFANRAETNVVCDVTLRRVGTQTAAELWNAVTGEREPLPAIMRDGRLAFTLSLPAAGSAFVVVRPPDPRAATPKLRTANHEPRTTLSGPWRVSFDPAWGGPKDEQLWPALMDWRESPNDAIRFYSGTAVYRTTFDAPANWRVGDEVLIALGQVDVVAEVWLNGAFCGTAWTAPYAVKAANLKATNNALEIRVTNLWVNRLVGDAALPEAQRFTRTNARVYKATDPLLPSGLKGPVTIRNGLASADNCQTVKQSCLSNLITEREEKMNDCENWMSD